MDAFRTLQKTLLPDGAHRPHLEDVFEHMRGRKSTDAWGRVIAAPGILPFYRRDGLSPDYRLDDWKVFRNVVVHSLLTGSLKVLQSC